MTIQDYAFDNSDSEYRLIRDLLLHIETRSDVDNSWDPGRMDWWRYNYHADKGADFFRSNVRYWKNDRDQVVGLFVSEYGDDDFFIVTHPDSRTLFDEILEWGIQHWANDKSSITTDVFSFAQNKIDRLLTAGFVEQGLVENFRTYSLNQYDFGFELAPGFSLKSFSEYGDYESRVRLVNNAFSSTSYTEERLRSIQSSPTYRAELDLVIVNDQNESVGYCMGWIEENDPHLAHIEPMGVHTDYRRLGFGKALAKACFRRLSKHGVKHVTIASKAEPDVANYLYESLNPSDTKRAFRYLLTIKRDTSCPLV